MTRCMAKLVKQHLKIDVFGTFGSEFNRSTFNETLKATLNNLILISKISNKKTQVSFLVTNEEIKPNLTTHV
jgi:hypothetical protein